MKRLVVAGGLMLGLVLLAGEVSAQTGTARGKVLDDKGQPLEGVKISIEFQGGINRKNETKTNKKGEYTQVGLQPGQLQDHGREGRLPDHLRRATRSTWARRPSSRR